MAQAQDTSCFLPTNVRPVRYDISLEPDLEKFVFGGEETIDVEIVDSSVNTIQLHSVDIQVQTVELDGVPATKTEFDTKEERVTFEFPKEAFSGKKTAKLHIKFTGELNDKLAGFYRSKYKAADGSDRFMATTQFEATDARKAFPCWDEPAQKAIFAITLLAPADRVVVSNMPELSRDPVGDGKFVRIRFADSPIMSTYLVAFVIGEFDFLEGVSEGGVKVRVYTPVGKVEQGRFPLHVAIQTLTFYENLFGIKFPLPKLDLLAIPDFAAGAMENWGAITYREARLLIDPVKTSTALKLGNMKTINHELAHMWFGNLVTMKWWDNLWLNEGFARYMEHVPVAKFYPEYDIWTQFVAGAWSQALDLDGLKTSHPIEVPVKHSSEINEIFDSISYAKGASVIRMLATFLGEDTFFKGIHNYLEKHKYANTVTENLWEALEQASGKPVQKMMNTWTKQMGYPVINVEEVGARSTEGGKTVQEIRLTQKRFLASDSQVSPEDEQRWIVPISIRTSAETQSFILEEDSTTVKVTVGEENGSDWIKVNDGSFGFYRVNYTPKLWEALGSAVKSKVLSPGDRLGLLTDASALASSGRLSTVEFLRFLQHYSAEEDYSVFSSIIGGLRSISLLLDQEGECYVQLKTFIRKLLKPTLQRIGWDVKPEEPQLYSLLRATLLTFLAELDDTEFNEEARKRFEAYLKDKDSVPADLQYPVLKAVARAGDQALFEKLMQMFKDTDFSEEQRNLLRALGQFPSEELIRKGLEFSLSPAVRSQDVIFLIGSAAHNPKGRQITWQWLQDNWSAIEKFTTGQNFLISGMISSATGYFNTFAKADEVHAFFETHPVPSAERTIRQSIESIRASAKWLERDLQGIKTWLSQNSN